MRHTSLTVQSIHEERARGAVVDESRALMRGVLNGVILSMFIWTAALYVAFVMRGLS
ncbi:MAG TPA: hypothetical protein VGM32_05120 [Rhodopila sp.]|jgi:hypothetical protein